MSIFDRPDASFADIVKPITDVKIIQHIENTKNMHGINYVTDTCKDAVKTWFGDFVKNNWIMLLIILCIAIFLCYRFVTTKKSKEHFSNDDYSIFDFYKDKFVRPTMNPHYPVKKQQNYAVYPPGQKKEVAGQTFTKMYPNYGYNQQQCRTTKPMVKKSIPL